MKKGAKVKSYFYLLSVGVLLSALPAYGADDAGATKVAKIAQTGVPLKAGQYDSAYNYYLSGNHIQALKEALIRARAGDSVAQTLVGLIYSEGYASQPDAKEAAKWFALGAQNGDPQSALRYGIMLYNGENVAIDRDKGRQYIKQAALAQVPEAYFYYGQILANMADSRDNLDQGLTWFLKGAAAGNADSAYAAAQILATGTKKVPKNIEASRRFLEIAAGHDHVPAEVDLANYLINGLGGERNYAKAFEILSRNAQRGFVPAQINLARMYRDGLAGKGDKIKAAAWYKIAKLMNMQAPDLDAMLEGMAPAQLKQADGEMQKILSK